MHNLLRSLSRTRMSAKSRYGLAVAAVVSATLIRLVAPLDTAPFLLYLPVIFLGALALGPGPAMMGIVLSDLMAGIFFLRDGPDRAISTGEWVALAEYLLVGSGTVAICDALRRAILGSERALADLERSKAALEVAVADADAARTAAEEANLAKSTFIANMSHELRTPLSAIIGYSEMMAEEIADGCEPVELASDMAKVEGNARHLLGLINDVLDLSKVESGKMDVYAEDFAVEPMLHDVAATVSALVAKKNNVLKLDIASGLGEAHTDLVKVRQVLLNLLSNAAKFTEDGTITLGAAREAGRDGASWLRLSVQDSGIGMSPEQLGRLFQRFTQADASTTRRFGGTGLGLSLSRAFAEMLGGTVSVVSQSGQGSSFTLLLPVRYAPPGDAPGSPDQPGPEAGEEDPSWDLVLVIDDDADQRALMTRALRRERFRVQVAADGKTGLALARSARPRAILLDVMMPGIDGWSVLTALKADPDLNEIPVIMVTSVDQRSLAASLGAADYMLKPVNWNRLSQVVARFHAPHGRVLLVEDEFAIRLDLRTALEKDGWTVTEAANGQEALGLAATDPPAMVLLDLGMPVMDGFSFLEELRRVPGCAEVPVVVLTARQLSREERHRLRGASQVLNMGDVSLQGLTDRLARVADNPHA